MDVSKPGLVLHLPVSDPDNQPLPPPQSGLLSRCHHHPDDGWRLSPREGARMYQGDGRPGVYHGPAGPTNEAAANIHAPQ